MSVDLRWLAAGGCACLVVGLLAVFEQDIRWRIRRRRTREWWRG